MSAAKRIVSTDTVSFRQLTTSLALWLGSTMLLSMSSVAQAGSLNMTNSPLFLGNNVDPNVFFLLDDSLSMDVEVFTQPYQRFDAYWEDTNDANTAQTDGYWRTRRSSWSTNNYSLRYVTSSHDNAWGGGNDSAVTYPDALDFDWRVRNSDFNVIYYNPLVDYEPWEGTGMSDASWGNARHNPRSGTAGWNDPTKDLDDFVFEIVIDDHGYSGAHPDGPSDATDGSNGEVDLWDSRVRYTISDSSWRVEEYTVPDAATMASLSTDCDYNDATDSVPYEDCWGTVKSSTTYGSSDINLWGRTLAQEQQNIANWFQYYRKRSFIAKGAIAKVISDFDSFRFGLTLTDDNNQLFRELPGATVTNYSTHNYNLLDALFQYEWQFNFTFLRSGLQYVGRYLDDALGYSDPIISECQQNFTLLLTDGFWNGNTRGDNPSSYIGDADGDGNSITLADVAQYYYDKDLSPLPNNVPTSTIDNNSQQHMVTFGVAFGVNGQLVDSDDDGVPDVGGSGSIDWGNPFSGGENIPEKIDDLWHAAYNSKGTYVAALRPNEVADALSAGLQEVADRVGAAASVAANSGSFRQDSRIYQARFDSSNWSGQLLALDLDDYGYVEPLPAWNARDVLETQNYNTGRNIISYNPTAGNGVAFRFPSDYKSPNATSELASSQLQELMAGAPYSFTVNNPGRVSQNQNWGEAMLDYLRGDDSNEGVSGLGFRSRAYLLGDFIDSAPFFMSPPSTNYPQDIESTLYSDFVTTWENRDEIVFAGANDGMLHAFNADTGVEEFAYIPSTVYKNLDDLADPAYTHKYYVNESPVVVDTYFSTPDEWRSVLVGGLGQGGQGLYALDVTDPSAYSEANASSIVLWEFTDSDDADLGYTFGTPSIVKLSNGRWGAVFGNGYNNTETDSSVSSTGRAYLMVVDIETGALIAKLDTEVGTTSSPNGLSAPAVVDTDGDAVADYAYAGDLEGNMWKFDLTDSDSSNWDVAYQDGSLNPQPLFSSATNQPITTRPQVSLHPLNYGGYMVFFGTGKYLEYGDNATTSAPTQSVYGIWDKNQSGAGGLDRTDLLAQSITNQYTQAFDTDEDGVDDVTRTLRDVSDNSINYGTQRGWYMDLVPDAIEGVNNPSHKNFGEKQVTNISLRSGRVLFTTMLPSSEICSFGGKSYTMALDFLNGGKLSTPAFDLTGDDNFSSDDGDASGVQSEGIASEIRVMNDVANESEIGFINSTNQSNPGRTRMNLPPGTTGRLSWRQVR